ncbi:thiol-disulfide isomerase/thioredoxin [Roseivirga pacifica]|uniref:Thiol-disulfide isomerase or thioredoxin n=1 Tax=Roseivirga pacifica TaxID=1267423 RepID=A0A1I0R0W2_9BACT|nr:TlpA disulfide reductase family protein [Roseivirga pacifica]RKQ42219.1 thiol-disulfide isomerase/thioredoxin [Roseivirga pacifica]SEW33728.1 Thiol-disulfide isomerase or thioredoxin [Roseivirga pacifica]
MKRYLPFLITLTLFAYGCNQAPQFTVYGEIDNYEGYVFLRYGDAVDSTIIEEGKFIFEGTVERVMQAAITNKADGVFSAPFYLDNDSVYVKTTFAEPYIKMIEAHSPANTLVTQVIDEVGAIMEDEQKLRSNGIFLYMDSITQLYPRNDFIIDVTMEIVSGDYITLQQSDKLLGTIDTTLIHPVEFEAVKTAISRQERINPGDEFPAFSFNGLNGETFTQESFPNQYLLIDVWATWCGPCIQSFEKLKPIYEDLDGTLEILNVSIDPYPQLPINFLEKNKLPWKQAYAEGEFGNPFLKQLGVVFLPFYYLISPNGEILAINPAIEEIPELIKSKGSLKGVLK